MERKLLIVFCGEREPPEVIQKDLSRVELHEMDSTRHARTSQSNSTVAHVAMDQSGVSLKNSCPRVKGPIRTVKGYSSV